MGLGRGVIYIYIYIAEVERAYIYIYIYKYIYIYTSPWQKFRSIFTYAGGVIMKNIVLFMTDLE